MNKYQMKDVLKSELVNVQNEIAANVDGDTSELVIKKEEIEYLLAWITIFRGYERECNEFNNKLEANGFDYRMKALK